MSDEMHAGGDLEHVMAELRELAAGRMLPIATMLGIEVELNCCASLDDMIECESALLVYLLERRQFAQHTVKAQIPPAWRGALGIEVRS